MARAYIAMGSNIGPEENLRKALVLLRETGAPPLALSTVYRTQPLGPPGQPDYLNAVVELETGRPPRELKYELLRAVEQRLGRVRTQDKYQARTIDLDLILYGKLVVRTDDLVLPDPDILRRPFLAVCLWELASELILPGSELSLREIVEKMDTRGMQPLDEYTRTLRRELFGEGKKDE